MTTVHPSYDPTERLWFLEDGTEAPTIRELLRKLPRGTRVAGYHPNGFEVTADYRSEQFRLAGYTSTDASYREARISCGRAIRRGESMRRELHARQEARLQQPLPVLPPGGTPPRPAARTARPRVAIPPRDWTEAEVAQAKAMSQRGLPASKIAAALGRSRQSVISKLWSGSNCGRKRRHDYDAVLNLWAAGTNQPDIAAALKMPKSTVTGIIVRCRRKGDKRAASREEGAAQAAPVGDTTDGHSQEVPAGHAGP